MRERERERDGGGGEERYLVVRKARYESGKWNSKREGKKIEM